MQQSLRLAKRAEGFCHYGLEMAARESKQNQRLPHMTNASLKAKRVHPKVIFTCIYNYVLTDPCMAYAFNINYNLHVHSSQLVDPSWTRHYNTFMQGRASTQ